MAENKHRILLNKGKIYWNGEVLADSISCVITITPTVTESTALGEITPSSRWAGVKYKVEVKNYKSKPYAKNYVKEFLNTGLAPEVTIQGIQDDKGSDYYEAYGSETITATGCIATSDITVLNVDSSSSDHLQDTITFAAKNLQF